MLSAILCDIYYAHMRKKYFSDFENFGYHFAYVDDNIYLTKSLKHAKEYIYRIKKGIPEYNCWFNESKLKYNFNKCDSSKIEYLGWMIDPHSLEIEPKYNSSRYSLTFASLNSLQ
ncbi:PREDICTED: telomerase reverse transcriptase-like [Ceratosolen solmsi marchali]|uniref:Telomerase reverse transcriptase n=1 Tax=Ceratosolen solmsi marchali TaxID=326594 RepID=A0AAJ6YDB6_9HYME|nr:PREDICTED: telomerase reverse transcriptase-like [Ceratosolen solmsi marchali]